MGALIYYIWRISNVYSYDNPYIIFKYGFIKQTLMATYRTGVSRLGNTAPPLILGYSREVIEPDTRHRPGHETVSKLDARLPHSRLLR